MDFVATLQNKKKATILGLLEILQFLKCCLTFTDINTGTHNIDLKKKIDKKIINFRKHRFVQIEKLRVSIFFNL